MAVNEIAPDTYRISTYVPEINLQFNQFLVTDDEPLLYHTGMRGLFPRVLEEVSRVIDPARLRWVGFSHFEADECGALNEWLQVAPRAKPVCSVVGALVSVNDVALRPARALADGEVLATGRRRFRFLRTPHVPHCWEAGLMFEETEGTLLCSDLLTHEGEVEPLTTSDVVGRFREGLVAGQQGPFSGCLPVHAADRRDAEPSRRTQAEDARPDARLDFRRRRGAGAPGHVCGSPRGPRRAFFLAISRILGLPSRPTDSAPGCAPSAGGVRVAVPQPRSRMQWPLRTRAWATNRRLKADSGIVSRTSRSHKGVKASKPGAGR